jgi:DNA-directed RNA polymerase subunit RPC12/RpoP
MEEAYVRLLCRECRKEWESSPTELPEPNRTFHCPNCHNSRSLSEFMRTDRDLRMLKEFA